MLRKSIFLPAILISCLAHAQHARIQFTNVYIDFPLEPASYGTGGFTADDFDNDGDLDLTIQREGTGKVYWYQNTGATHWAKYELASDVFHQLGAASLDINKDGYTDVIMGTYWFENPGHLKEKPNQLWIKHEYKGAMSNLENHDIVAADINQDGHQDMVAYCQNFHNSSGVMRWYDMSDPLNFKYHDIDTLVNKREMRGWNKGVHAGFAPAGIGDLNGDGWVDVVMPQGWYENPKNESKPWLLHRWTKYGLNIGIKKTPYGTSIRSWVGDLNHDGFNDIVFTDCDVENSKAYVLYNVEGGKNFRIEPLPFPKGPSGSLHSLGVADMDGDGDLDIFAGEQEDPDKGMKPTGLAERGILWINNGSRKTPFFEYQILNNDNPGWHDTILKDIDGDGDIDLITKVWNADEGIDGNPDRVWHLNFWRNETIKK